MPEIKNTFNQGKMNKDLDERLIPKGQYRDALNISVATSEGSDVGTVQNIMGNSRVDSLSSGGTCVGSISNELTNKLYTFVKMLDRDVIVEYDKSDAPYSASSFIAVDLGGENAFLKFTGKQVTGVNIIDDFLFWTDGDSEPKKINIEETRHKENPTNINLHSRLYIDGEDKGFLTEDYVTVIKKKPSIAPTYKMNSAIEDVNSAIFEKIFPRFCFRYKYRDGEYSAMGPFTDVVFNSEYDDGISSLNSYSTDEPYNKTMTNVIKSIDLYDFVPSDIPKDVVQVDLLYKQENSNVVYSIDNIKYTDSEWSKAGSGQLATNILPAGTPSELVTFGEVSAHKGKYNISTESIHAALPENQLLRPWDNVPRSALAQEIVGNRIVYGNYTQGYNFGKDIDGNFLKPNVWSGFELRETQDFSEGGLRSLKSKRDYQVGVVFGDKYGRETPVFTSKKGVKIDWRNPELGLNASNSNMFKAYIDLEPADWIDYYKFYIKETSGEYYNLIMDKAYTPPRHVDFHDDNNHLWLSFASSDRNKIVKEDFITVKKIFNNSLSTQPLFDNKYKVLDISNEAPEAIKYTFSPLGRVVNNFDKLAGYGYNDSGTLDNEGVEDQSIFLNPDARIDKEDTQDIEINATGWLISGVFGSDLSQDFLASGSNKVFISWEKHGTHSKRYRISSVTRAQSAVNTAGIYHIKLSSKISAIDANIAKDPNGDDWLLHENLTFKTERRDEIPGEDFSGKFFVKIKTAVNLLINEDSSLESQNYAVTSQQMYWLYSAYNTSDNDETSGLINTIDPGEPDGTQYPTDITPGCEPIHWSNLFDVLDESDKKSFFIDNLPFIASNPSASSYAKESGEGWFGAQTYYRKLEWKKHIGPWKGVSYDDNNSLLNLALSIHGKEWQGPLFGMSDDLFNNGDNVVDGFENLDLVGGGTNVGDWENSQTSDMDYYTWRVSGNAGGRGVTPEVYLAQGDGAGDRIINGLEGIMTSTVEHTSLWRRWNVNTIYPSNLDVDNTYGTSNSDIGKHYMHLSFLGPGEDLIDLGNATSIINDLGVTSLVGKDSIASKLQGIWGGGIFNLLPTASQGTGQDTAFPPSLSTTGENAISPVIAASEADGIRIMEFEGNYDEVTGIGRALTPSELQGQGYDDSYQNLHLNQWRPEISPSGLDTDIQFFVSQLEEGNRFIFKDDPGKIVYTIQKVRTKHIYNHTSWRMRWIYDGDDYKNADTVDYPLSVEEAASAWANSVAVDANQTITGEDTTATQNLIEALENFGARHNRRTCYIIELDKNPTEQGYNPGAPTFSVDDDTFTNIEFLHPETNVENVLTTLQSYPAIWETEPQQLTDLNIYYEASSNIPVRLTSENAEIFAPVGCRVVLVDDLGLEVPTLDEGRIPGEAGIFDYNANRRITNWIIDAGDFNSNQYNSSAANTIFSGDEFAAFELNYNFPHDGAEEENSTTAAALADEVGDPVAVKFIRENGSYTTAKIKWFKQFSEPGVFDKRIWLINKDLDLSLDTGLSWYNCFSFGDGIESNRIRDTFNEMQITNGARASSTLEEPYAEEHRKHGLIYSGIYNSNSGINNLNQFIQAEKITKDLNPTYGSIQKLFTRSTDLVAMCEDRVLKILANKDAVFNADGNPQLVATENVLGQAVPFVGDYGISKNPESFASESYRAYFTDKQRGSVLRLSMDGLTPISDAGMRDWFRDNLSEYNIALGSYDDYSKHYNLTLDNYPVDTSNLLTSSNVDQGTELVTYQNDVNHFQDSFPLTGVDLIPSPHNINETWQSHYNHWGIPDIPVNHSFIPLKNMSLNSSTAITHHPAIPKGHFVEAVEGQDFVGEAFGEFLQAPIIDTPYDSFNAPYSARFNLNAQEVVADIGAFSLGNNIFIENHGSGTPLMYASRFFTSADGVETTYDGPPDAPASNTLPAFVGSIWRLENQDNDEPGGIVFSPEGSSFLSGAGVGTAIDGGLKYSVNILDSYVDSPITDLTHQVSDDIIASFPEATSKTIFNGEEIAIYFTTGVFNITDPFFQLADGFNMLIELFDGEEPVDPEIIAPLGDTQFGNANYILNNLTDSPYEAHHMLFTDWTGYSNGNPDIAFAGDYVMGWQSNNEVLFPAIWAFVPGVYEANDENPVHGSPTMNSAAWKFSDGTTQDSVLIENLVVKLSLVTKPSAVSTKYSIYVNEFKLVKPHSLINPTGIEGQDFIQEVNPIPYRDIPAWAEVKHGDGSGGILGWTGDVENNGTNLIDFVWTNQIIYGRQNLGQSNTEYEAGGLGEFGAQHTYYSPTINEETGEYNAVNEPLQDGGAITNFGDHIDLSDQPVPPIPGEQPDPFVSIHEVSGDNTGGATDSATRIEVDADSTAIISQDISDNPLENGNWYLLDISYQPVVDDIDANSDVSLLNCIPTGLIPESPIDQDSGDPSYPYGYFGEIKPNGNLRLLSTTRTEYDTTAVVSNVIRCIFQYPFGFPPLEEIKIAITKHDYAKAIDSIRLINITNLTTGGKADSWITPPSNYLGSSDVQIPPITYNLFDQPEVYFKNGAIEWNTTQGPGHEKFIYQNISPNFPMDNPNPTQPYEFSFTIIPVSSLDIQGSLAGYVTGNTEDVEVDGVTSILTHGFGFNNLTQPGDYVIKGNMLSYSGNPISVFLNGEEVSAADVLAGDINGFIYSASTFAEDESSPLGNPRKVFFEPEENGFTGAIKDIALRDTTNYFTGGTVDSWNIVFSTSFQNLLFWEEDPAGGGRIRFEGLRAVWGNINQNIGHIHTNQEVRLSFDCALDNGFIAGYYYNEDGKGFVFQTDIEANVSFEQDFFIGTSTNDDPDNLINTVVITSGSNDKALELRGTLDNITLNKIFRLENSTTVSFNEDVRGWESFKSFVPESGVSLSNQYFTVKNGELWQHYTNETRGSFYGEQYEASVTAILNETPSSIKSFNTINYEGSQAMVKAFAKAENSTATTLSTYNAFTNDRLGWEMESFETDLQKGFISEFIEKEGKWFNYIKGSRLSTENIDTANFNFQGLGIVSSTH